MESLKHVAFVASGVVSLFAVSALKSMFGAVFTEEWKAWTPHLAQKLMRGAVRWLPSEKQERYLEEWTAALADTPGFLGKVFFAFDLHRASFRISRQSDQAEARKVVTTDAEALRTAPSSQVREVRRRETRHSAVHRPRPRVLVVDDDRVIANTLALILEQSGYAAKAAFSGEEGIAVARDFKPQTVITDVIMTGITGIETGILIRSFLPECQVWLFVGQAATRDLVQRAAHAGHVFNILDKPIHPVDLLSRLKAAASATSENGQHGPLEHERDELSSAQPDATSSEVADSRGE